MKIAGGVLFAIPLAGWAAGSAVIIAAETAVKDAQQDAEHASREVQDARNRLQARRREQELLRNTVIDRGVQLQKSINMLNDHIESIGRTREAVLAAIRRNTVIKNGASDLQLAVQGMVTGARAAVRAGQLPRFDLTDLEKPLRSIAKGLPKLSTLPLLAGQIQIRDVSRNLEAYIAEIPAVEVNNFVQRMM